MQALAEITTSLETTHRSLEFIKWLSCLHLARGVRPAATARFLERWPDARSVAKNLVTKCVGGYVTMDLGADAAWGMKAAVAAGNTVDPAWAGALTNDRLAEAFFTVVKRASVLGRIPGLGHIPFRVKVPTLTQDAEYVWVGEGQLKPVSRMSFDDGITLGPTKGLGIVVTSREIAEIAVPGLEGVFHTRMVNGLTTFTDRSFLDPAAVAVPDVQPGSITNGVTPIPGTGDLLKDIDTLTAALFSARPTAEAAVLIAAPGLLAAKDVKLGVSVVTSSAVPNIIVALDPAGVFVADAGIAFDVSTEAMVQLSDAPVGTAAAVWTSLWQENLAAFRVERFTNWEALPGAVQYVTLGAGSGRSSRRAA